MGFIGKQPAKAAITSSDITDGVVTADKLASDSVTTAKIADNGVTTAKINADAVTDAKIADDVVGTEHLTAGEVDTTALGADAVTAAKIADDAISDEHLDPTAITGQTAETSAADDDLILLSDTSASAALKKMTRSNFLSGVGGSNSSQFAAYGASGQSISSNSYTKINIVNEFFDVDSNYDASNSKFVAPSDGKYCLFAQFAITRTGGFTANPCHMKVRIYKNGSGLDYIGTIFGSTDGGRVQIINISAIVDASASDYFEVYGYHDKGSAENTGGESLFQGFKLIS